MGEIGYCRVSTTLHDEAMQREALQTAGVPQEHIYSDRISGTKERRPGLDAALSGLQPGDRFTVWKLDRLGRSLSHLMRLLDDLERQGVTFRSLTEAIDTSAAQGKLTARIVGSFAAFERDLIRERTLAGLEEARRQGKSLGRHTKIGLEQAEHIFDLRAAGHTHQQIAQTTGLSKASVGRALRGEITALSHLTRND